MEQEPRTHELTLTLGDVIAINGIEVKVVSVQPDRVRLGITAPPEVAVHRREIYLAIRESVARDRARLNGQPPNQPEEPR